MRILLQADVVAKDGVLFLQIRDFILVGSAAVLELPQLGLHLPTLVDLHVVQTHN